MSLVNKLCRMGFALWFALSQVLFGLSAAHAQSGTFDVEPPLIEHDIVSSVEADIRQSFFAVVVDDNELDSVSLFYRFQNDPSYSSVLMDRVSYSSTYIVHVPTDPASDRSIEYYIQARDKAGNRTVRGYAFNPLLREVTLVEAAPAADPIPVAKVPSSGKKKTILYVVLGVVTLGLIAGLSKGSTSGPDPEPCPDGLCTVTVSVGRP